MKIYRIDLMGNDKPTYATAEDVRKVIEATNKGVRLVLVRQTLINPASVARITRAWEAGESNLDPVDESLIEVSKNKMLK